MKYTSFFFLSRNREEMGVISKGGWLDRPGSVDKVYWAVVAICAVLFAADAFYHKHGEFEIERMFGAHGVYGFVCCVFLVVAAKEMRRLVMRGEDYYDDPGDGGGDDDRDGDRAAEPRDADE